MVLALDHLVVCAETVEAGSAHVEQLLGVEPEPGGRHVQMGTHNRLVSLGSEIYLEVIAIDPGAAAPGRVRWFDLDRFAGPPRLTNWIARCDDLTAAVGVAPAGIGDVIELERGDLRWRMAVPHDGRLPFGGAYPGLISWLGSARPAARLVDRGCRLQELRIVHPDAAALSAYLELVMELRLVTIKTGPEVRIEATIDTPTGVKVLR
ncbi:MAG: VOC family protein [Paracoccaceae bacterium]